MKKISFLLLCMLLNIHILIKTSYFEEYDSSPDTETSYFQEYDSSTETEIDIYEHNDQEFEPREVSVASTLVIQLHQCFYHDGLSYKEIEYDEFAKKYANTINDFIETAIEENKLTEYQQQNDSLYIIVGAKPFDKREPLYNCEMAREKLITLVNQFIDKNEQTVRQECIGHQLQRHTSKVVWSPGCCDIQLHKNCFQQCRNNNMHTCMNLLCQNPDWTTTFYQSAFKKTNRQKNFVPLNQIRATNCPLCMEPLRIDDTIAEQDLVNKKRGLIIDKDGLTAGGKKTRFL